MRVCSWMFIFTFGVLTVNAWAGPTRAQRFEHADKNNDGIVDRKEIKMEKAFEKRTDSIVNTGWERKADTNNDGIVDSAEKSSWQTLEKDKLDLNNDGVVDAQEKRLSWRYAKSKVNTPLEAQYDANADGWLEPVEAKKMLASRSAVLDSNDKIVVDTEIERQYDLNSDGFIDKTEAKNLLADLAL